MGELTLLECCLGGIQALEEGQTRSARRWNRRVHESSKRAWSSALGWGLSQLRVYRSGLDNRAVKFKI